MADAKLLFHVFAIVILLYFSSTFGIIFLKRHTKYHLVAFVIFTFLLIDQVLVVFSGNSLLRGLSDHLGTALWIRILIVIVLSTFVAAYFLYPYLKHFLYLRRMKNPDKMEKEFHDRIKHSPQNPEIFYRYANFLWHLRKDYNKAMEYYQQAIELDPRNANILCSYARFLMDTRKDYSQTESYFQKALELDPKNIICLRNYAYFLWYVREDYNKANAYFLTAINAAPKDANVFWGYANFWMDAQEDYDHAEEFYKRAIELDTKNGELFAAYAYFLEEARRDYDGADKFFRKAIKIDPKNARILAIFAKILILRGNLDKAKTLIKKAFEYTKENKASEIELDLWVYCYAVFNNEFPESGAAIEALLKQGVRSHGRYFKDLLEFAKDRGHHDYQKLSQYESKITGEVE